MNKDCKDCHYFIPYWEDSFGIGYCSAHCEHTDCFEKVKIIDRYGEPTMVKRRVNNIKDFNMDKNCSHLVPFKFEVRTKWKIFKYKEKVPVS